MSKFLLPGGVLLSALLTCACTGLTVRSDVNPALAASVRCHSYTWAGSFNGSSPLRGGIANPVNEDRLRSAIAANLNARGIQQNDSAADCIVGYGIGSMPVISGGWYGYGGYGYGWGGWGPYGYPYWGGGPYVYHEGIIAVDVYDARSRQALWHASVDQSLHGVSGPEAQKRIDEAVAALFTKYPG